MRVRSHRKRRHGASHFALVPFIDMMTILVVFLLAHTAEVDILPNTKNISIPQSLSDRKPSAAVVSTRFGARRRASAASSAALWAPPPQAYTAALGA